MLWPPSSTGVTGSVTAWLCSDMAEDRGHGKGIRVAAHMAAASTACARAASIATMAGGLQEGTEQHRGLQCLAASGAVCA